MNQKKLFDYFGSFQPFVLHYMLLPDEWQQHIMKDKVEIRII